MAASARPGPAQPSRAVAILELALSLSGVGLSAYIVLHFGDLSSILLGTEAMDAVASFFERYYLLPVVAPLIIILAVVHILLSARKVPTAFSQQRALVRHLHSLGHLDTWTWALQVLTGAALLALGAIHLWVVLADLPIQAAKSGSRVFETGLWLYVPFVLLVVVHMSIGLYRVAVKWGLLSRRWAHSLLLAWTVLFLGLGFAILATLYRVGGNP